MLSVKLLTSCRTYTVRLPLKSSKFTAFILLYDLGVGTKFHLEKCSAANVRVSAAVDRRSKQVLMAQSFSRYTNACFRSRTDGAVVEPQLERDVEEAIVFDSFIEHIDAEIINIVKFPRNLLQLSDNVVGISNTSRAAI